MRIVCYVSSLSGGGAERVMSVLANGLSDRGHDVILVTEYSTPNEYALLPGVKRRLLSNAGKPLETRGVLNVIKRTLRLRKLCHASGADILVSFIWRTNAKAILATRFLKTKNLVSVRNDPRVAYGGKVGAALAKFLYSMADGCVFQTKEARAWFPANIQEKSRIILNPISDAFYDILPVPMQEKRIVTCGRLAKQKRFDLLIDAFHKVCDEFPEYKLEIYGVGALQETLQAQIDKLGRQDRICLMGRSHDVPNTIKTASLFVLSSDYEGLPNALMEAMVLGLPVISTDCSGGGARALIDDGVDGLIVPCGDVDALAAAVRKSLSDLDAAKQRGEKAAEKAKSFSTENIVAQWEAYIAEIVNKK